MAISSSSLISRVRVALADVPTDMLDDIQVYRDIERANAFVTAILRESVTETLQEHAIINLAAYYSYVNYTSLAERQLGNVPQTAIIRLDALKQIARAFLELVSSIPITADLVPNDEVLRGLKSIGYTLLYSTQEMSDYE